MPSVKTLILSLAGLIAISFIANEAWYWYEDGRFIEETDNAYVKADSIAIRPEISARIKAVLVHENQHVKAGTVMVQLDEGDYLAQVSEADVRQLRMRKPRYTCRTKPLQKHRPVSMRPTLN